MHGEHLELAAVVKFPFFPIRDPHRLVDHCSINVIASQQSNQWVRFYKFEVDFTLAAFAFKAGTPVS